MQRDFQPVFEALRALLQKHAGRCRIDANEPSHFILAAPAGPATLQSWRGQARKSRIPVAWVKTGKRAVSYHLMGVYCSPALLEGVSAELRSHLQGKSCFHFKSLDPELFTELDRLTSASLSAMETAGFTVRETAI